MLSFTKALHSFQFMHVAFAPLRYSCHALEAFFFVPSRHHVEGLVLVLLLSTTDFYNVPFNRSPLRRSTCPNYLKTFEPLFIHIFSHINPSPQFFIPSTITLVTLHILRQHMIPVTSSSNLSSICLLHISASYVNVGTT